MTDVKQYCDGLRDRARHFAESRKLNTFRVIDDEGIIYAHRETQTDAMKVANHFHTRTGKKMNVEEKTAWSWRWSVGQ